MPRARTPESAEDAVIKKPRAPRARAILPDGAEPSPKRTPRKVVQKITLEPVSEPAVIRRAPTPIAAERRRSNQNHRTFFSVLAFCVVLSGIGVGIGVFDRGTIDVVAVVNDRNEKISRGEVRDEVTGEPVTLSVPVQNMDNRPNGGLQIADPVDQPPPPLVAPETASSTATSTPAGETASSTDVDSSVTPDPALKSVE